MATTLTEGDGRIEIRLGADTAAQLFAIPFLLVGVYLAYQLVGGVLDIIVGRAAVTEMLAGTVLLLIVTAAFLVPGWLLMFATARVVIDRSARTVTAVRDLRIHRLTERHSLDDFNRIEVDHLSVSPNRSNPRSFQVELARANRKNLVVGLFDDGEEALKFGHRLGAIVALSVEDRRKSERPRDDDE